jgi:hypothetical protein
MERRRTKGPVFGGKYSKKQQGIGYARKILTLVEMAPSASPHHGDPEVHLVKTKKMMPFGARERTKHILKLLAERNQGPVR